MIKAIKFIIICITAYLLSVILTIDKIYNIIQPMIVFLSIITAAVFVRLNRGMPTIPWESIPLEKRKTLTENLKKISLDYAKFLIICSIFFIFIFIILAIGGKKIISYENNIHITISYTMSFLLTSLTYRMFYIVWRDYDIVCLQKVIIDGIADTEKDKIEKKLAYEKIENIKSANMRKVENNKTKNWDEK